MSYANPYLICEACAKRTTHFDQVNIVNLPCGHQAGVRSLCLSWGPVDGCSCNPVCRRPARQPAR